VAAVIVMAGCSGGGGGNAATPSTPIATQAAPVTQATTFKQSATAVLTFPHGKQVAGISRDFVSPNSTSISVSINSVNGAPPPSWVPTQVVLPLIFSGAGQNCTVTNGIATCSVTVPAPPGNVLYTIATYAVIPQPSPMPNATQPPPTILDYNQEVIAIKQGVANQSITVTLEGVVKGATLTIPEPLVANQPTTLPVTVTAYDASGAAITGTKQYNSPFKINDADPHGPGDPLQPYSSFFIVNNEAQSKIGTITSPTDVVSLVFHGLAMGQFQVAASSDGGKAGSFISTSEIDETLQPIVISNTFVDTTQGDPSYGQTTVLLNAGGPATTLVVSELGLTNAPYSLCNAASQSTCFALSPLPLIYNSCNNGIANFLPAPLQAPPKNYTYTVTPTSQTGFCLDQFYDGLNPGHAQPGPSDPGNPLVNGELWVKVQ